MCQPGDNYNGQRYKERDNRCWKCDIMLLHNCRHLRMPIIISFGQKGAEKDLEWMTGVHDEDVSVLA